MNLDINLIPIGNYCYDGEYRCPYWSMNDSYEYQNNGYCSYLGKGDWDINKEKIWKAEGAIFDDLYSGEDLGLLMSLLWDSVKECGVNESS